MKNKFENLGKMLAGKVLSKNEQKNTIGGYGPNILIYTCKITTYYSNGTSKKATKTVNTGGTFSTCANTNAMQICRNLFQTPGVTCGSLGTVVLPGGSPVTCVDSASCSS